MGEVITGKALAVNGSGEPRPYLRTKNVYDGRIDIDDVLSMPMTDKQFRQFMLKDGDVLLNEGQSLELVGRCAIYGGEYPGPCAIQNQLLRFRAHTGVSGLFASHLFRYCQQKGVFARVALQTTSIAHLGGTRFEQLLLPWPPTEAEQRAVAAALSDVDVLLAGLDRLIAKKRDLKQAAMQQLLTGQTRLPGFSGKWNVKPLGDLGHWRGGSTPLMSKRNYWVGGTVPWLSSSDVRQGWIKNVSGHITEEAIAETSVPLIPPDSVIVVIRSGILRRFLPVARCSRTVAINQDLRALHPGPHHDPAFLVHALVGFERHLLLDCLKTGTTVESIDSAWFRGFEIPMPSIDEQRAIAAVLSNMDAEIAALERRRDKTHDLKQAMIQELLTGKTRLI